MIEPPNPHRILGTLRDVEAQLQALALMSPGVVLLRVALGGVALAVLALGELPAATATGDVPAP
jgi:hypothetical protein